MGVPYQIHQYEFQAVLQCCGEKLAAYIGYLATLWSWCFAKVT